VVLRSPVSVRDSAIPSKLSLKSDGDGFSLEEEIIWRNLARSGGSQWGWDRFLVSRGRRGAWR